MTANEKMILEFVLQGKYEQRCLADFEDIMPIAYNKKMQWQIRGGRLGKLIKKDWLYKRWKSYNRYDIIYTVTKEGKKQLENERTRYKT
jgi:hypothetical protein